MSGDTAPLDLELERWEGCDVLVHEVYSSSGLLNRSAEWKKYHSHMHTSGTQLGRIAKRVRPKILLLTHILCWGGSEEELLDEIATEYDGEIILGHDLGVY